MLKFELMRNFLISIVLIYFGVLSVTFAKAEGEENIKKYTISGHVQDKSSGEDLIGATIYVKELKAGTTSNIYGFYSLSLIPGTYTIQYSYIGFKKIEKTIDLKENVTYDVELTTTEQELDEVVITGEAINENVTSAEMSSIKMDIKTIRQIPAFMGEVDIIKAIQLLPGVQSISEG